MRKKSKKEKRITKQKADIRQAKPSGYRLLFVVLTGKCRQHLMFSSLNILRMASNVVMRVGTSGRRSLFPPCPWR